MPAIRTILHPTDFSASADLAFDLACALAAAQGATIHVLHVGRHPVISPIEGAIPPESECFQEELMEKLRRIRPADPRIPVEHQLVFVGNPAAEILRVAQRLGADLIVMGTHGRTGMPRLLMGSVAEQVMHKAACPVVAVKSPLPGTCPSMETAVEATENPEVVTKE